MTVKIMEKTIPLKPAKSGYQANEFFELEAFKKLEGEYLVEPKYDGVRCQAHRKGEDLVIFTDEGTEIQDKLSEISQELRGFESSTFILDAELVKYDGRKLLSHEAIVSDLHKKDGPIDETSVRFKFFDILWLEDEDITDLPLIQRKAHLENNFPNTSHCHQVKSYEADSGEEVVKMIKKHSTDEGAVIKKADSKYSKEYSKDWYKYKIQKEIDAQVMDIEKTKAGANIYHCGILDEKGKLIPIGKTFATKLEVKKGDILRVAVDRVMVKDDTASWLIPKVMELREDKKEPDAIALIKQLAHSTLWEEALSEALLKGEWVLQNHWWGKSAHYDLRLTKNHGWFGFTIPGPGDHEDVSKLDGSDLSEGFEEGKKYLALKKAYYGGMEYMDYGKDEVKEFPPGDKPTEGNPSTKLTAYMKAVDWGKYELEKRTETEFIINYTQSEKGILDGRYFIIVAPESMQEKGEEEKWLMSKAKEQEPEKEKEPEQDKTEEQNEPATKPGVSMGFEKDSFPEKNFSTQDTSPEQSFQYCTPDSCPSILNDTNKVIAVTIITPGVTKHEFLEGHLSYTEEALKKSLPLWDGAACFCDHFNKSVRNIAGVYYDPYYDNGVKAKLRFIDDNLYKLVSQIIKDRDQNLPTPDIGISADLGIRTVQTDHQFDVIEITRVVSADIVFSPAAGGSFDRILNEIGISDVGEGFIPSPNATEPAPEPSFSSTSFPSGEGEPPTPSPPSSPSEGEDKGEVDSSEAGSVQHPALSKVEGYEKRVRDLQSQNDKLRNQLTDVEDLRMDYTCLLLALKEALLKANPIIPEELLDVSSLDALETSFRNAEQVVEKIKEKVKEETVHIPAGAPPRQGPDVESMSSTDKIKYGLQRRK